MFSFSNSSAEAGVEVVNQSTNFKIFLQMFLRLAQGYGIH